MFRYGLQRITDRPLCKFSSWITHTADHACDNSDTAVTRKKRQYYNILYDNFAHCWNIYF